MGLPRQLHDSQPISRLLRFDIHLCFPSDGIDNILVISSVPAEEAWIFADVVLARLVKPLALGVKLLLGRQSSPDTLILEPKVGIQGRLTRRSNGLGFLRAGPKLMFPMVLAYLSCNLDNDSYFEICPFGSSNEVLQLILHGRNNGRFDCDDEILFDPNVLQNDRKRVIHFAFCSSICPKETCHRSRSPKEP